MTTIGEFLNEKCVGRSPSELIFLTASSTIAVKLAYDALRTGHLLERIYSSLLHGFRVLANPYIRRAVAKITKDIKMPSTEGELKTWSLPEKSNSEEEVLKLMKQFHKDLDKPFEEGGLSGTVYHGGDSHTHFINQAMELFQWSNPLHTDVFGATRKMEAEIVSMVVYMYNGHLLPDACGALTSGGTESIMMAMKAYRDWGRATRGFERLSVVAPVTAHPAFDKAAEYLCFDLIKVPVDPTTMRVVPEEMEKYIRYDTVAIVGNATSFPHGVIDDIPLLSEIALRYHIGLHVDSCLGGFIVPFLERTGRAVPMVDFRNRGVTTISCDTHKYGYAPKGTSTVLYRTKYLRSFQFCCVTDWPGGMYCSPAASGSKPGNVIAGTWAAMMRMGVEGYVKCCDQIMTVRETLTRELENIPFLYILGDPVSSVVSFSSDIIDIFNLGNELGKRGWMFNRLQFPSGLQFSVTMLQTKKKVQERLIEDIKECVKIVVAAQRKSTPEGKSLNINAMGRSLYGSAQRVPDRTIIKDVLQGFLDAYYTV